MITKLLAHIGIAAVVLSGSISIAFAGPDLTVTECVFTPAQPKEADRITIKMTFKNVGDQPAVFTQGVSEWSAKFDTLHYTATASSDASRGRTLAPGATFTDSDMIINPGDMAPGAHTILVTADPNSKVAGETSRTNNTKNCVVTVAAGGTFPSQVVMDTLKVETSPITSANVVLTGTIKNIGKGAGALPVGTLVSVRDFGDLNITQQETIAPGATRAFRVVPSHMIQPGRYTFHAQLYPSQRVEGVGGGGELRDLFAQVLYSGRPGELAPDLVIDSCVFDPVAPTRSQVIKLRITFKNIGTADARIDGGSVRWKAFYQGRELTANNSNDLIILKPGMTFVTGASEQIFKANVLPVGTTNITAIIDADGWVVESNETNNQKTCSITVK